MSLRLYIESARDVYTEETDRIRADTIQLNIKAAEGSVGSSAIEIDDPDADFYIAGLRGMYFIEEDATGDDWFGMIGPFYAWNREIRRGSFYNDAGRTWTVNVNDVNTLLTRRLQKGGDAKRPQETDVSRMQWLIGTAEVIGGGGDAGFTIEDTDFLFTDSAIPMDKTDYTGQDSSGVLNDALQDSGKSGFLFAAPLEDELVRVGIWYGRTERTEFSSVHRISNVLSDVDIDPAVAAINSSPASLIAGEWTFAPSRDATLDRDPSRVASGVMVMYDGGYVYETRPSTASNYNRRDMLMQAELVKTEAQARRRSLRYLRDLRDEDDAIEVAVVVPAALIHAFLPGHRVQVKFSHLPGYSEGFVWMRVAAVTYRQLAKDSRLYELALDLRSESPPDVGTATCSAQTASTTFYPLGGSGDTPNASDGHVYYWNPGEPRPIEVADMLGEVGHWHFPNYSAGGSGTTDYAGDCAQNRLRILVEGSGTLTINTATWGGSARNLRAVLHHHRYGESGDAASGVDILDLTVEGATGDPLVIPISTHDGLNCTHWVDVTDLGGICGGKWGWTSAVWVAS
jgi:hypothetical protein